MDLGAWEANSSQIAFRSYRQGPDSPSRETGPFPMPDAAQRLLRFLRTRSQPASLACRRSCASPADCAPWAARRRAARACWSRNSASTSARCSGHRTHCTSPASRRRRDGVMNTAHTVRPGRPSRRTTHGRSPRRDATNAMPRPSTAASTCSARLPGRPSSHSARSSSPKCTCPAHAIGCAAARRFLIVIPEGWANPPVDTVRSAPY